METLLKLLELQDRNAFNSRFTSGCSSLLTFLALTTVVTKCWSSRRFFFLFLVIVGRFFEMNLAKRIKNADKKSNVSKAYR